MEITSQDIIDKEFRVKFRGFDMAEVDSFLEEVAENFFKLTEENTVLHEKIITLRRDLEAAGTSSPTPVEFPPELNLLLEDLKQDTEAIGAELASLKQDRQGFDSLKNNLEKILASLQESSEMAPADQGVFSADLADTLEEIKKGSIALNAELSGLKEDRRSLDSLKNKLEEILATARRTSSSLTSQAQVELSSKLGNTLEDFKKGREAFGAELAALKQEVAALSSVRTEIKGELQDMFSSHFATLEAKLSAVGDAAFQPQPQTKTTPAKKEKLLAAKIVEQAEDVDEDTRVPEYEEQEDVDDDSGLDFLNEDDILDVDKLRGMFQSVLEDTITDGPDSRGKEDNSADLLFFDDDFMEDQQEPQVTFSLDENKGDQKTNTKKD